MMSNEHDLKWALSQMNMTEWAISQNEHDLKMNMILKWAYLIMHDLKMAWSQNEHDL